MEVALAGASAGAIVKVVLDYLVLYPEKEVVLLWYFKRDRQELTQLFSTIQKFVEDVEKNHVTSTLVRDDNVRDWLQKLEALAFDADYVLDQLNYQRLRKKVDKEKKLQVSSFLSTNIPFSFRHKMARKINDIKKKLRSINEEARDLGLQMRVACAPARGVGIELPPYAETNSFYKDRVFVGRDNDVRKMLEMLTSGSTEHVISVLPILGMGGLGKTTLARKVYQHAKADSNFGICMWVHVGNFDSLFVLRKAVELFTKQIVVGSSMEALFTELQNHLKGIRYLLVLDNVWNVQKNEWVPFIKSLEGISSAKGNVIMVTTRSVDVASIVKTLDSHELGVLSVEDCWLIIKAEAFEEEVIPSQFEAIGANIARRCGGLPLAAQVVGSLLRGKPKDEWVSIEKNWLSKFAEDENSLSNILKLSVDNLPQPSMKKCFALCSIFPKNWWIEKDELIQLWMAEGFFQTNKEADMEIVGNNVLNHLVQSSLIEVRIKDYYGNVTHYGMHDLMHDLASSLLNPKFLDDIFPARYMSTSHVDDLSSLPKKHANSLRVLFFVGKASQIRFSNFKCLHILILVDDDTDKLPIEIGELTSLRYLDIWHTRIESLPDSIGDLYHLQTLRANFEYGRKAYLRELPDTFKYLISLRHLHIPNIKLPPKIGKLISLQTLPYFQVGDEEGCGIMELGSLKNLKGEIEIHNLEKVGDKEEAMSADLFHKPNLLKLKLVWNKGRQGESNDADVLEGLQPHPNLKILEIDGFKGTSFPQWTSRMAVGEGRQWVILDNLIEIKLSDCEECEEIPMLGHLPHLKYLYLQNLSNVKSMGSSFYGVREKSVELFPVLEKLELIGMAELTSWEGVEVSAFNCLEYLKIIDCMKLKSAPRHFPCLKELEVNNMESGIPLANMCGGSNLSSLIIVSVDGLERLPDNLFFNNRDLSELEIIGCDNLKELVTSLSLSLRGGGASLRKMKISWCMNFIKLPDDLHCLNGLEELMIVNCPNLKSIPSPENELLSSQDFLSLRELRISFCGVTELPIKMIESCASSLEMLNLYGSKSITNFPQVMSILPKMPRLITLHIEYGPNMNDEVVAGIGCLRGLVELGIGGSSDSGDHVSFSARLDRIFPTLQSLRLLSLAGMNALPDQLQHLTTLQGLGLYAFEIEELPGWLRNLSSLKILTLFFCQKLKYLPSKEVMQGLTNLTHLNISFCPLLKQSLEGEANNDDSEWSKISHIPIIMLDGNIVSAPAQ